jgi:hypothetical protein
VSEFPVFVIGGNGIARDWCESIGAFLTKKAAKVSLSLRVDDIEAKMTLEWIEVAVAVKERVTVPDAVRRDDAIDRLSYGYAAGSQRSIVSCGGNGCFLAARIEYGKGIQLASNLSEGLFVSNSLQHFAQNEVSEGQRVGAHLCT